MVYLYKKKNTRTSWSLCCTRIENKLISFESKNRERFHPWIVSCPVTDQNPFEMRCPDFDPSLLLYSMHCVICYMSHATLFTLIGVVAHPCWRGVKRARFTISFESLEESKISCLETGRMGFAFSFGSCSFNPIAFTLQLIIG